MNERSQDFMFTAQSCLYCHDYLTCENIRKDFDSQNYQCNYDHKRCKEETCDTCCDYAHCLLIQYPTCDNKRIERENKECSCKEIHNRCTESICTKCCDFYNKIVSCRNCYLQGRKCEWSRIMCETDFDKEKENEGNIIFYSAGFERGSKTQKLHLQGYLQFNTRVTGSYVKSHIGRNLHINTTKFNPHVKLDSTRR